MAEEQAKRGAWIFVSHSTKDVDAVRAIRNELERLGHHPLLFFLKCVSDGDELHDLLKREIKARTFFLLCDSPNARQSRWVQQEMDVIKTLQDRTYEVIDLASDWRSQVAHLELLAKKATVFLSYTEEDRIEVRQIARGLEEFDYDVFFDVKRVLPDDDSKNRIQTNINEALSRGFFLYFISTSTYFRDQSVQFYELYYALHRSLNFRAGVTNVVTVLLGDIDGDTPLPDGLTENPIVDLRNIPPTDRAHHLHKSLSRYARSWNVS